MRWVRQTEGTGGSAGGRLRQRQRQRRTSAPGWPAPSSTVSPLVHSGIACLIRANLLPVGIHENICKRRAPILECVGMRRAD